MKKLSLLAIICLIFTSLLVGCSTEEEVVFTTMTSEDNLFSIDFPGEPTYEALSVDTPTGPRDLNFYLLDNKADAYSIMSMKMPEASLAQDTNEILINSVNGAIKNTDGHNEVIEDIMILDHLGKKYTYNLSVDGTDAKSEAYITLIDGVLYQFGYVSGVDTFDDTADERTQFFNSFVVNN